MFSTFGPTCPLPFAFGSVGCSSRFAQIILVSALRYFLRKRTSITIMRFCDTPLGAPRWRTTPTHPSLPSFAPTGPPSLPSFAPTGPTPTTVLPRPSLTLSRVASKIILQAGRHNFRSCWSRCKPGTTSEPAILALSPHFFIWQFGNLRNHRNRTMGTDGSGAAGAPEPHDCEAAHYVVTNHRPGSVHLTARCSFLGPDTQVSSEDIIGWRAGRSDCIFWRQINAARAYPPSGSLSSLRLTCSDV